MDIRPVDIYVLPIISGIIGSSGSAQGTIHRATTASREDTIQIGASV